MNLIDNVLKTAEKTVVSNVQNLRQQGVKKFIQDSGIDTSGMTQEALMTAYNAFKSKHPEQLLNGEYLGNQVKQFSELLTYSKDKIKEEAQTISIHGYKMNTKDLMTNPQAVLHNTAETMVDQEIDRIVQGKVGNILKQHGIITGDRPNDEVRDLIRNTIRGTKNSIFKDPELKQKMVNIAEDGVNAYYKSVVEMLENPDWQQKQLKPLNDIVNKQFDKLDGLQGNLNSKMDDLNKNISKYSNKLDALSKLDLAKEINQQVTGKLDISGQLEEMNKKLGMFGLDQTSLDFISKDLNNQITGTVNNQLGPTIQKSISKLGDINKKVVEVQQYVQKYEDFIKNEIKAFEDKAKEYIKNIETKLVSTILSSVHLKLGGGIKLKF